MQRRQVKQISDSFWEMSLKVGRIGCNGNSILEDAEIEISQL
jgi:hypothetical protein